MRTASPGGVIAGVVAKEDLPADREFLELLDAEHYGPKADRIAKEHTPAKAREYQGIVRGERTPLTVFIDQWMTDIEGKVKPRTRKHYSCRLPLEESLLRPQDSKGEDDC